MKRNNKNIRLKSKASLIACLFLFPFLLYGQDWSVTSSAKHAYAQVLDLAWETDNPPSSSYPAEELYIHSLSEALTLLLTEDPGVYKKFESRAEERINILEDVDRAASLFVMAEIRLQWSFIHLKFGEELDAAWDLRQSYLLVKQCRKKYPRFTLIDKTSGILNIMIGSVPEKYDWILSLLGMNGNVAKGIEELTRLQESNTMFSYEARLLKSMIEGYVFQQPDAGMDHIQPLLAKSDVSSLALILASSLSVKNSKSEEALSYINILEQKKLPVNLAFIQYLKGEVNLHKGDYYAAITAYQLFIDQYAGKNHIKDAWYKAGIACWLDGNQEKASYYLSKASAAGQEETEADKYAARSLRSGELPDKKLAKIRYFTDGGYYDAAKEVFGTIHIAALKSESDVIEYYYRKARLFHKTNNTTEAIEWYQKTIRMTNSTAIQSYFAPNACLQLGYIFLDQNDIQQAEVYFNKALTYKKHEYKNSIDSKARSALDQLKDRK